MNTNEVQDVFRGRVERVLEAIGKDREKVAAKGETVKRQNNQQQIMKSNPVVVPSR